jgi:hypothetical protein
MLNLDFRHDGFLRDVLEMTMLMELRLLKHKTRIPVEKGWHLHGLMDETGFLEEGEMFCCVLQEGKREFIRGCVVISRAPALHPGDVQIATAGRKWQHLRSRGWPESRMPLRSAHSGPWSFHANYDQ